MLDGFTSLNLLSIRMTEKTVAKIRSQSRKIKLLVKTDISIQFLYAASPDITISELQQELGEAIQKFTRDPDSSFYKPELHIRGTANLRKGDYYLLPSATVGDSLMDFDEVKCDAREGSSKANAKEDKTKRKAE